MNTSVRARRGARGFSFVELLVTIVIAGIAFLAMVPLFVTAQEKNSGDTFRNVATQMAQDRIELVRQLDYDQITEANLNSDDFPTAGAKLFSQTVPYYGGSASSMTFHVQTGVALVIDGVSVVPSAATLGTEQFKTVTVVAWWGPADPTKAEKLTKLQTQIYKQYAGPQLLTFTAATLVPQPLYGADLAWITAMPLTLEATVAEIDRPETAKVHFSIRDASSEVAYLDVTTATSPGTYTWVYAGPMNDGVYTVSAQAKSTKSFSGNLVSLPLTVEQGPPAQPLGVKATSGVESVTVTWVASTAADLDHYEVYRFDSAADPLTTDPLSLDSANYTYRGTAMGNVSPSYVDGDASLQLGKAYYYIVYALDKMGTDLQAQGITTYRSLPSGPAKVVMEDMPDQTAPPVPAWVGAPFSANGLSVAPVWTKVIDDAPPPSVPSGTKEFIVERESSSDGGSTWGSTIQLTPIAFDPNPLVTTQFATDSTLAYGTMYRYRVLARDVSGNSSAWAAWTNVTVPLPTRSLRVTNSQNGQPVYAYVTSTNNLVYYNQSGAVVANATLAKVTIAKKSFLDWTLTDGDYAVHYSTSGTIPFPVGNVKPAPKGTPSVTVP